MSDTSSLVIGQSSGPQFTRLESVGGYVPERVVPNDELVARIESSDEWIQERSGIKTRHFARPDESAVDMAQAAAEQAMERAGVTGAAIDGILVGTVTHPYQTPSVAALLAHRIGATPAMALDVSSACSGFCHALGQASDMIRAGSCSRVLAIGVEKLSDFIDFDDRSSAFIFGDGAGAALVVGSDTENGIGPVLWGSDGSKWDHIIQEPSWVEAHEQVDGGEGYTWPVIHMQGRQVFRWAVWQMAPVVRKIAESAGLTLEDIDVFVPHQANMRIIDAMIKQLDLPGHIKVARSVEDYANTSAASVPLALNRMVEDGDAVSGDIALLIGFGAGLTYAGQVVRVP